MSDLRCPFELEPRPQPNSGAPCAIVSVIVGWRAGAGPMACTGCIKREEWNVDGVPHKSASDAFELPSLATAETIVSKSPFFMAGLYSTYRGFLVGGDCQLFHPNASVSMAEAFTKFRETFGDDHARVMLTEMSNKQIARARAGVPGCDSEAVVRDKIATLAEANGFITTVEADAMRAGG
jgi:hypothetical protein